MQENKLIYFVSDIHLGAPSYEASRERERNFVSWLQEIYDSTEELHIVGDLFDFWFEYKTAVPKGYVRTLAEIARFTDNGKKVYLYTGNHDMWMFGYLEKEIGVEIIREPRAFQYYGYQLEVGHGDGLGPGDHGYKFIKKVFANPVCQWLFARLHPNFGIGLANYFSRSSIAQTGDSEDKFFGHDDEWLIQYCKERETVQHKDFYIFGHRHLALDYTLKTGARYINLGDWLKDFTYFKLTSEGGELLSYKGKEILKLEQP